MGRARVLRNLVVLEEKSYGQSSARYHKQKGSAIVLHRTCTYDLLKEALKLEQQKS